MKFMQYDNVHLRLVPSQSMHYEIYAMRICIMTNCTVNGQ
jgi:hypothetical protein